MNCDRTTASYASGQPSFRTGIQPAELCRNGSILSLAHRAMEPKYLLNAALACSSSANALRLKSRHPFVPAAQQLNTLSDNKNIRTAHLADHQWNVEWTYCPTRLHAFIPDTGTYPPGMTLPRTAWVRLNLPPHRHRTFPLLLVQMGYGLSYGL